MRSQLIRCGLDPSTRQSSIGRVRVNHLSNRKLHSSPIQIKRISLIKAENEDAPSREPQDAIQEPATVDSSTTASAETSSEQPTADTKPSAIDNKPVAVWRSLLTQSVSTLKTNFWPLVLAHLICDALIFLLHRFSHRVTNETAIRLLTGITPDTIGNMWWLSADPAIANFQTGYQALTVAVFILAFPLNIALKTAASISTLLICRDNSGVNADPPTHDIPWWKPIRGLMRALPTLKKQWSTVVTMWSPVFVVELMVAAVVVPLQFASLAVVTLPLTVPIILDLQGAAASAVLEGTKGMDAIKRSWTLIRPIRWQLAIPFVGLVVIQRLSEALKGYILTAMPPRYYKELVELPIFIVVAGAVLSLVLSRLQDVLPFAAYEQAVAKYNVAQQQLENNGDTKSA